MKSRFNLISLGIMLFSCQPSVFHIEVNNISNKAKKVKEVKKQYEYQNGTKVLLSNSKTIKIYDASHHLLAEFAEPLSKDSIKRYQYNSQGHPTEERIINPNGTSRKTIYKYDGRGNEIEASTYDENQSLSRMISHHYDDLGFLQSYRNVYPKTGNGFTYTFKNDASGNHTYMAYVDDDPKKGKDNYEVFNRFDPYGREIESKTLKAGDESIFTYTYNQKGAILKEVFKSSDATSSYEIQNVYDHSENLIETTKVRKGNAIEYRTINSYDVHHNLVFSKTLDGNNVVTSRQTCSYDDKGNKLSDQIFNGDLLSTESRFSYDHTGNLVKEEVIRYSLDGDHLPFKSTITEWQYEVY